MTDIIRKTSEISELKVEDMDKGIVSAYVNTKFDFFFCG